MKNPSGASDRHCFSSARYKHMTSLNSILVNILAQQPPGWAPIILMAGSIFNGTATVENNVLKHAYEKNIGLHNSDFEVS